MSSPWPRTNRTLAALTCGAVNLPNSLIPIALPPSFASKLLCTTTDSLDDSLPLLAPRGHTSKQSSDRAALKDRWERALRLARVVVLHGVFDAASLSFWSPGGRIKKLLARRDVELVLDQRWAGGIAPLSGDTWVCWLNREPGPRAAFDLLAPPSGACALVANFQWRREAELSFEPISAFLGLDDVRRIASSGGDVTLVFHVRGEREHLRPMPSADCLLDALAAYLGPSRRHRDYGDEDDGGELPTLTLVGLDAMEDADVFAMSLDVLEPSPRKNVPVAMWCLLRSLEEYAGVWYADSLFHLTVDEWAASTGRHAALMIDTAPFAARV